MAVASFVAGASAAPIDLEWSEGDSASWTFIFEDQLEDPLDLSGTTFIAQIRRRASHSTAVDISVDTTDAAAGVLVLSVPAVGVPRDGVWDLRQLEGGEFTTLVAGSVRVAATVARSA